MSRIKRNLTDFYNTEFREYALYTLHSRALPTLLDGLKPVHKKILWTALRRARSPLKTVSLAGYVLAEADYKHGDMSAIDTVVKMASEWRHQVPLLDGHGNFGFRMVPDAGAPRYTKVSLSKNFENWFSDFNALEYKPGDDGNFYDPICYHANVPWLLINGFRGIATGYSCFCHPRKPDNIIKLMTDILSDKQPDETYLDVNYPSYDGIIEDGYSVGRWKQKTKKRIIIESLPVDYTVDTFSTKLVKLVERGIIRDFHKTIADGEPPFVIDLKNPLRNPEKTLGLRRKLTGENFVFIHQDKLIVFDSIWDYIIKFVEERLPIAGESIKQSKLSKEDIISRIETKIKFIKRVRELGAKELKRKDLITIIDKLDRPDMKDTLLSMPISRMVEESIEQWMEQVSELRSDIEILNSVTPDQWLRYNILNKPLS